MEALAFWGFLTVVSLAGIIGNKITENNRQKLLRSLIEKDGIDEKTIEMIMKQLDINQNRPLSQNMKMASPIMIAASIGVAIFALLLQSVLGQASLFILAGAGFMFVNGIGFYFAGRIVEGYENKSSQVSVAP